LAGKIRLLQGLCRLVVAVAPEIPPVLAARAAGAHLHLPAPLEQPDRGSQAAATQLAIGRLEVVEALEAPDKTHPDQQQRPLVARVA
jgi:hypothetical protein